MANRLVCFHVDFIISGTISTTHTLLPSHCAVKKSEKNEPINFRQMIHFYHIFKNMATIIAVYHFTD